MATYDAKTLYDKWKKDELTHEQAIGHLVQRLLERRTAAPPPPPAPAPAS